MPRRKWIKLWTQETLYRSISQELAPEERWVWIAFLCLAGDSVEPGVIMAAPDIAWTQEQLAQIVKVPLLVMQSAFQKMLLAEKIEVNHGGIIYIKNWEKYQTNWDRVRKYPSQSPKGKPTTEPTAFPTPDEPTLKPTKNHTTEEKRGEGRGGASSLIVTPNVKDTNISKTRLTVSKRLANTSQMVDKGFNTFWKAYPKKVGKLEAREVFIKINPDAELLVKMLASIKESIQTELWMKEGGKFILDPVRWLKRRRWEDEGVTLPDINTVKPYIGL